MTFNIQHGELGLERIAALLRELAPDLVFLQEVDRGCRRSGGVDQAQVLADALGFHCAFGEAMPFDGGSYGLALLSRWPLTETQIIALPHQGPPQADGRGEPRILLGARTAGLLVGCTHLGLDEPERIQQAYAIRDSWGGDAPLLLGGDFNDTMSSRMAVLKLWLNDAFAEAGGVEAQTAPPDRPGERIDYIFRTPAGPKPRTAWIGPPGYSDHRPVIVEFES